MDNVTVFQTNAGIIDRIETNYQIGRRVNSSRAIFRQKDTDLCLAFPDGGNIEIAEGFEEKELTPEEARALAAALTLAAEWVEQER